MTAFGRVESYVSQTCYYIGTQLNALLYGK